MSNHAARPHPKQQSRKGRLVGYLFVPVVVMLTVALAPFIYRHWFLPDDAWPSFPAQVLSTRVVPAGTLESPWGQPFLYRLEIDAAWTENGSRLEAWVPTNKMDRNRAWLALWAAQRSKHCIVRQSPHNPSARLAFFQ